MNFFEDHTKVILSADSHDYILTFINQNRQAVNYHLLQLRHFGCHPDIAERLRYARTVMQDIIQVKGEPVWSNCSRLICDHHMSSSTVHSEQCKLTSAPEIFHVVSIFHSCYHSIIKLEAKMEVSWLWVMLTRSRIAWVTWIYGLLVWQSWCMKTMLGKFGSKVIALNYVR